MPIKMEFKEDTSKLHAYYWIIDKKTIAQPDWFPWVMNGDDKQPIPDNYMFGDQDREEAALYLGFAWNLADGLDCFVIPKYYRDNAAKNAQLAFQFVNWEYNVDVDQQSDIAIDKGFARARVCIPMLPLPSDWQKKHEHEAGLFHVQTFDQLGRLHHALLDDATSEISLFCLKPGRSADLLAFLTSPKQPDLLRLLLDGEMFIDVVLGVDMGYRDSILI